MGMEDNPDCAGCRMNETAIHLLTECPTYAGARMAILGRPLLDIEEQIRELGISMILKFAEATGRWG